MATFSLVSTGVAMLRFVVPEGTPAGEQAVKVTVAGVDASGTLFVAATP